MRLLAYGGTSFTWRCRIGVWPELAAGYLQSKTGLFGGRRSVGFLPPPAGPALVLREIQSAESRGGYAYTLLLDPGEEHWARFGWNAAALAHVLLKDDAARASLLERPDSLSPAALAPLMEALGPPALGAAADARLPELLAGAAPLSGGPVRGFALSAAGLPDAAEPSDVARALQTLPVCFRAGSGFLVHGSPDVAAHLGARLLLDADERERDGGALALAGRETLGAFEALRRSGHAQVIEEVDGVPLCRWRETLGEAPEVYLPVLRLLASLATDEAAADELYARLAGLETRLATRLAAEAQRAALHHGRPLGPEATRFLLGQRVPLDETLAARLDAGAAVASAVASGQAPDPALPKALRLRIWQARCDSAPPDELPALALAAAWDLPAQELGALLRHALSLWSREPRPLHEWKSALAASAELARIAAEPLRREALRRLRDADRRTESWVADYLEFGADEGGAAAAEFLTQTDARALVTSIAGREDDAARAWIAALATSPLRELLDWPSELAAAYAGGPAWQALREVDRMLLGDAAPPPGRPAPREPWTQALRKGLKHLRQERGAGGVPALATIAGFLGSLPKDVVERFERLQPELTWESAERWLEGWKKLGQRQREEEEFQRLVAQSDPPPLAKLTEGQRERLLVWVLHALRPNALTARANRAQALLPPMGDDEESRGIVDAVVARHLDEAARVDLGKASGLLSCLSETTATGLLERRLRTGRAGFADDLARVKASGSFLKAARTLVENDERLRKELSERRFEAWWEGSFLERIASRFRDKGPRAVKR